ncbi:hypothetical protein FMEAI12_7120002 [Parafrankia sp. Ea1.12]|nr:hypothetical protein FMEAI12_7120002 [Parafrankia sp. Ea1.12]
MQLLGLDDLTSQILFGNANL